MICFSIASTHTSLEPCHRRERSAHIQGHRPDVLPLRGDAAARAERGDKPVAGVRPAVQPR